MTATVIVGAGLLGASLGQALTKLGHQVFLDDSSELNLRLAVDYGAGRPISELGATEPALVAVCVPPDLTAKIVAESLAKFPTATVTDVASVKASILEELKTKASETELTRYVGSHPMAGREKAGPASARADLFFSRPWVITPHRNSDPARVNQIRTMANELQALPVELTPGSHDDAVALVSHLPQLMASILASKLTDADFEKLNLAGQGLRDTVRIAASDPNLWIQIISRNAVALTPMVKALAQSLNELSVALEQVDQSGSLRSIHELLMAGNQGAARIPGKHGGKSVNYATVTVLIDDTPGQLAKLLTEVGEIGVNLEDMLLSHSPGAPIGIVELSVMPDRAETLSGNLAARGWRLA